MASEPKRENQMPRLKELPARLSKINSAAVN